jgi:hypothetical protein
MSWADRSAALDRLIDADAQPEPEVDHDPYKWERRGDMLGDLGGALMNFGIAITIFVFVVCPILFIAWAVIA